MLLMERRRREDGKEDSERLFRIGQIPISSPLQNYPSQTFSAIVSELLQNYPSQTVSSIVSALLQDHPPQSVSALLQNHHFQTTQAPIPTFNQNYPSQSTLQDPLFLESDFARLSLNPLHVSSSSSTNVVPSPSFQPHCLHPSYNIWQNPLQVDRSIPFHDAHITQLHNIPHTQDLAIDTNHNLPLPQSHLCENISYGIDPHCCSGCGHCGGSNMVQFNANRQFRDVPVLEIENLRRLSSQYHPHLLPPTNQTSVSLDDLRGGMVSVARDKYGCRFLQKKIEEGRSMDIDMIFSELKNHIRKLMVDPFGNYLVQKLAEVCSEEQRTEIVYSVTNKEYELIGICLDAHGARTVQKLLDHLTTPLQISRVVAALEPGTVLLTKDMNGYHVMLHCFHRFPNEETKNLSITIEAHCIEVATNRNGCRVFQQCVEHAEGEQKEHLMAAVIANALVLAQDKFGNYVVQFLLGLKLPHVICKVLRQLQGNFIHLSMQKFSSNVVEKCLNESSEEELTWIIKELFESQRSVMLLQDAYGNYVVQSALKVAKGANYDTIVGMVKMHQPILCSHPYGKKVLSCINSRKLHARRCTCQQRYSR